MSRSTIIHLSTAAVIALGALSACSSDSGTDTGGNEPRDSGFPDAPAADAEPPPDTGRPDTGRRDAEPRDADPADTGPTGDDNESFDQAVMVPFGSGAGVQSVLAIEGDHDFYRFDAPADSWVLIAASATDPAGTADTVVTLYDSAMMKIAENDDVLFPQGARTTNSEVVYYVPAAATYYVEVQEYSTWAMQEPLAGGSEYTYRVQALQLLATQNGVVIDPETGNDAMSAVPIELGRNSSFILGNWVDQADVDVYRVSLTGTETQLFVAHMLPFGPDGQGSTSPAGLVWLTDVTGSTITARIDNAVNPNLSVPMEPGNYLLWVSHAAMPLGANDFYSIKPDFGAENDPETSDPQNDTLMGAQPLVMTDIQTGLRRGFIIAKIPQGDVDYFSFDVRDMEHIGVVCAARFVGSGLRDLNVELRDSADVSLGMATEPAADVALIEDVTVTSTGTYYLRLTAPARDPEVHSDWARCAVSAFIP